MCLPAEPSHSAGKMPWKGQFLKKYFFDELVTFKETQKKAGGTVRSQCSKPEGCGLGISTFTGSLSGSVAGVTHGVGLLRTGPVSYGPFSTKASM